MNACANKSLTIIPFYIITIRGGSNANSRWHWDPKRLWYQGSNEFKLVQVSWLVGNALERIARNYYMQHCWDILRKELFAMGHKSSVIARKAHIDNSCDAMADAVQKNEPLPQLHVGFRIAQAHEIVGHVALCFAIVECAP